MSIVANAATTPTVQTTLRAEGFSCPSCVAKIEKQVGSLPGVESVTVHFASGRIEIAHDPVTAAIEQLVAAVGKAGYKSKPSAF